MFKKTILPNPEFWSLLHLFILVVLRRCQHRKKNTFNRMLQVAIAAFY